jgi:hypothetical protein
MQLSDFFAVCISLGSPLSGFRHVTNLQFQLTMQQQQQQQQQQLRPTEVLLLCRIFFRYERRYISDDTVEECADAVLAKVEADRKLSMIRAWEESEKSKAENKSVATPHILSQPNDCRLNNCLAGGMLIQRTRVCSNCFRSQFPVAGLRRRCHPSCRGRTQRRRLWKQSCEHERSEISFFPRQKTISTYLTGRC